MENPIILYKSWDFMTLDEQKKLLKEYAETHTIRLPDTHDIFTLPGEEVKRYLQSPDYHNLLFKQNDTMHEFIRNAGMGFNTNTPCVAWKHVGKWLTPKIGIVYPSLFPDVESAILFVASQALWHCEIWYHRGVFICFAERDNACHQYNITGVNEEGIKHWQEHKTFGKSRHFFAKFMKLFDYTPDKQEVA